MKGQRVVTGSPAARVALRSIRIYQLLAQGRTSSCRFTPSCSVYGYEAVERHGVVRGSWITIRRLSRCHPWGGYGLDPVPD